MQNSERYRNQTENIGGKRLNNKDIYLREPPKNLSFSALFKFIWKQGIGNRFGNDGEPVPWRDQTLCDRFMEFGYNVDKRTLQNWLSGSHKPSPKNLHRLAKVISNNDSGFKKLWLDALTIADIKDLPSIPQIGAADIKLKDKTGFSRKSIAAIIGVLAVIGVAGLYMVFGGRGEQIDYRVTNLKFCDKDRFSETEKVCTTDVTHFPAGTKLIFVSFNAPNAPEGQYFERKWFRKGQEFLSKDGYIDAAWEDYTWLQNPDGHDNGKYNLRIIINKQVTTGTFFVGDVNGDHESP